jgi:hypothetical protein
MAASGRAAVDGFIVDDVTPVHLVDTNLYNPTVVIHNRVGILFVKTGVGCSSSNYTYRLNTNAHVTITDYMGPITAIMQNGTGYVDVSSWG